MIIIAIGLLIAGGVLIYQNYSNKNRILTSFNELKESLIKTFDIDNNKNIQDVKQTVTGSTNFYINPIFGNSSDGSDVIINGLNNSVFNYEYCLDMEAKKMYFDGSLLLNMQEILGINFYQNENISYIFLRNIFDKYITIEDNDIFSYLENTNKSNDDIDYIYNLMIKSLENNITIDDIKVNNEKIGNENTKKISLDLNKKRLNELSESIIKDLKKDNRAKKIVGEFIEQMETSSVNDSSADSKKLNVGIEYNIYLNKNNIIRYELMIDNDINKFTIRYNDNKTKSIELLEDGNTIGSATITNADNSINIALTYNNKNIGVIKINNSEIDMDITIQSLNLTNDSVNIKYNSLLNNNNISTTFIINLMTNNTEIKIININDSGMITNGIADFSNVNTSNNVNIDNLSDIDMATIENNLMTVLYNFINQSAI